MKKPSINSVRGLTPLFLFLCLVPLMACSSFSPGKNTAGPIAAINADETLEKTEVNKINLLLQQLEARMDSQKDSIRKLQKEIDSLKMADKEHYRDKKSVIHSKKSVDFQAPLSEINTHSPPAKIASAAVHTKSEMLYKKARNLLLEGNFKRARGLFVEFIKKYPDNDLADNAYYWLGECHYTTGDYRGSVEIFKALVKKYPKRGKVPDALLKIAYAYISIDDSNRANYYLKLVVSKYPFSKAGEKAELKLKTFQ